MAQYNRVYVGTATVGTGTLTLGAVVSAQFCTFANAGAADGDQVRSYIIEEGTDFEIGYGIYNSAGPTLTRATVRLSRIAGVAGTTKMTLAGAATVRVIAAKEDLVTQDTSGYVGIGQSAPVVPLHIGANLTNNSGDSQVLVSRAVDNSVVGNGHCYSDSSAVDRSGTIAYNSYDMRITVGGSQSYDHFAGFQFAPTVSTSGTTAKLYGLVSVPAIGAGTVTNLYHAYAFDASGAGAVTNQYGFYCEAFAKGGTLNYAFFSAGTTPSSFGGAVTVGGQLLGANGTVSLPGISLASDPDCGLYRIGANNIGMAVNGAKALDIATTGVTISGSAAIVPASGAAILDISGMTAIGTAAALPSTHTLGAAASGNVVVEIWETGLNVVHARYVLANGSATLEDGSATVWDVLGASAASGKSSVYFSGGNIVVTNNVSTSARYKALMIKAG